MDYLDTLKRRLAERFVQGDWMGALSVLQQELVDAVSQNAKEREAWIHLLAGICYQKWGRIDEANSLFDSAQRVYRTDKLSAELLLYRSKTASQTGNFGQARDYLESLYSDSKYRELLGSESRKSVLWRLGLAYLMTGDSRRAKTVFAEHGRNIERGGFREANNILFSQVVFTLCQKPMGALLKSNLLERIRYAADIYAHSEADIKDRLAHRGKPIVHALVIEAFYHWKLGNKFTSFQQILVGGEFLKRCNLTPQAEGVGEMVAIVKLHVPLLIEIMNNSSNLLLPHFVSWIENLKPKDDSRILLQAYRDAASIATAGLARDLYDVYGYWPEVKPLEQRKQGASQKGHYPQTLIEEAIKQSINVSRKSRNEDGRLHPKVGVAIIKDNKILTCAYRGELEPGDHAEYTGLKKCPEANFKDAILVTTLEPCTSRKHDNKPCALHIVNAGFRKVLIGMLDPNPDIRGKGVLFLQRSDVDVEFFPPKYQKEVVEVNKEFWEEHWKGYKIDIMKEFKTGFEKYEKGMKNEFYSLDDMNRKRMTTFENLRKLRTNEIDTICRTYFGEDFRKIKSDTRIGRIRELIHNAEQTGRMDTLTNLSKKIRT